MKQGRQPLDPFAQGDSESALSRRDFLERTAYAAGLAGMAALPAGTLISEAARAQARSNPLPSPRNLPIDHFVILMMENRSFDHYFGWGSAFADATQDMKYLDPDTGQKVPTQHASVMGESQWQGCGHPDPGHGWDSGRAQLKHGFLGRNSGNDIFALTYYNKGELPLIHAAASQYVLFDRYFCSLLGPTFPNRYYKWSAQSGGKKNNSPPVSELGNQWETIFDRAAKSNPANLPGAGGPTYRYFNSDLPFSAVWGPRAVPWTSPIAEFYARCETGTLPNISIVDPPFRDGGGGDGLSADEHPHGDVRLGQAFMSDVVHAFMNSKNYKRGALFIVYDEWGGFFDHVKPPTVPDDRRSSDLYEDFGQMGFRIPAVAVSPFTRRSAGRSHRRVDHGLYGHESILKLIEYRFKLGHLTKRDEMANNIGHAFQFDNDDPDGGAELPDPGEVVTSPCSLRADDQGTETAHESDLAALEELAEKHGIPVGSGNVDQIFRQPDTIRKAVRDRDR